MSKAGQIEEVLRKLKGAIPELRGALVATTDGLPVATDFSEGDAARIAAMAATALGLGKRISQTTGLGDLQETVVRGGEGYLMVYNAGTKAVLAVAAPAGANLGLIHLEARSAAQTVGSLMDGS